MFLREVKSLSGRELSEVFQRQLAVRRRVSALTGLKALKIVLLFGLEHKTAVGRGSQLLNLVSQTLDGTVRVELSLIKVEQRLHGLYVLRFGNRQSQLNGGIDFEALDFRLMGLRRCGVLSLESSDLCLERLDVAGRGLEGLKLLVALLDGIGESFLLGVQSVEVCARTKFLPISSETFLSISSEYASPKIVFSQSNILSSCLPLSFLSGQSRYCGYAICCPPRKAVIFV